MLAKGGRGRHAFAAKIFGCKFEKVQGPFGRNASVGQESIFFKSRRYRRAERHDGAQRTSLSTHLWGFSGNGDLCVTVQGGPQKIIQARNFDILRMPRWGVTAAMTRWGSGRSGTIDGRVTMSNSTLSLCVRCIGEIAMRGRRILFLIVAIFTLCAGASMASQKAAKPLLSERFNCGVRASGGDNPGGGLTILVSVAPTGGISWNRKPIDQKTLSANLESATSVDPQPAFIVEADAGTPYGRVAPVIWALQRVGIAHVTCIVPVRTE